ncbi:MAG: Rieske protein [Chloroflexi bacterium]|nr:Rieske protein [Chloroflexota bacterium]
MLTKEENDLLTQIYPGTPAGEMLRRYWQPAALAQELPLGGAPVPIRLLGEDLVLFRDEQGRPGLLAIHCSHRGADLSYGRIEDGGLRCIYHGWLYDVSGRCLEQPGEPAGSTFHERIRHRAYPCVEVGGLILAYMGSGEPPLVPAYEFLLADDAHRLTTKLYSECNYLQGNEGNFDPQHLSFLHKFFNPDQIIYEYCARDPAPTIEPERTDFGMRLYAVREVDDGTSYVKIRSFMMPNLAGVASNGTDGYNVNWHVPIDDENHWRYSISFRRQQPMDHDRVYQRSVPELLPGFRSARNRSNRYLQDRDEMKTETFIGMGRVFQVHDMAATEGEGPIFDRTAEHLGYTDRGVIALRQIMFEAIKDVQEGRDPLHVIRDPASNVLPQIFVRDDTLPASADWRTYWKRDVEEAARAMAATRA